ncbi:hypothetical protein R1sor_000048 [Riccia sorocarpa]|uniref:Ribonuclease H n=1 Tax=Riccia sorocarpa TaxID=122646 RepID=A0ABD3GTN1_9MARC
MSYYAVARGHCPGVYLTWEQSKNQVENFPNARHKKFSTRADAKTFIEKNRDVSAEGNPRRSDEASGQGHVAMLDVRAASSGPVPPPHPIPAYYAVAKGRVPGIYSTWDEASVQVKDMYSAKYKKFYKMEEAEEFIEDSKKLKAVDPNDPPSERRWGCRAVGIELGFWFLRISRIIERSIEVLSRRFYELIRMILRKPAHSTIPPTASCSVDDRMDPDVEGSSKQTTWRANKLVTGAFGARQTTGLEENARLNSAWKSRWRELARDWGWSVWPKFKLV